MTERKFDLIVEELIQMVGKKNEYQRSMGITHTGKINHVDLLYNSSSTNLTDASHHINGCYVVGKTTLSSR